MHSMTKLVRNAAASAALIVVAVAPLGAVAAPDASVIATGGTTIDFFGNDRHMSFTVKEHPVTGVVSGQLQLNLPATGVVVHAEIESYYDTGTDLLLVGPITHSQNAAPVGDYFITSVRDGGQGGSDDTITFATSFPFAFTAEDIVLNGPPLAVIIGDAGPPPSGILGGYHPITGGNVTIH